MANRNFPSSRVYSMHYMPIQLDLTIAIGASGAVSSFNGLAIKAVTKLATGVYQIQMQDNYAALLGVDFDLQSPVTGSNVNDGSLVTGTLYQITAVGTTNWAGAGFPSGLTPAVGACFVATGAGGAGTGTAKAVGNSGISAVEIAGNVSAMLNNQPSQNGGGYVVFQTLAPTSSSVTTSIPANPASGSTILAKIYLSNSSVQ